MDLTLTPAQRGALDTLWDHFAKEGFAEPHYPKDVIRMLRVLQEAGEELVPDAAFQWAIENGWDKQPARDLHAYATVVRHWDDGPPLKGDVIEQWRARTASY